MGGPGRGAHWKFLGLAAGGQQLASERQRPIVWGLRSEPLLRATLTSLTGFSRSVAGKGTAGAAVTGWQSGALYCS